MEATVYSRRLNIFIFFLLPLLFCFFSFKNQSVSKLFEVIFLLSIILFLLYYTHQYNLKKTNMLLISGFVIFSILLYYLFFILGSTFDNKYFLTNFYYLTIFLYAYVLSLVKINYGKSTISLFVVILNLFNLVYFVSQYFGVHSPLDALYTTYDLTRGTRMLEIRPNGFLGNSNYSALFTLYSFIAVNSKQHKIFLFAILSIIIFIAEPMATMGLLLLYILIKLRIKLYILIPTIVLFIAYALATINIEDMYSLYHRFSVLQKLFEFMDGNILMILFGGVNLNFFLESSGLTYLDSIIPLIFLSNGAIGFLIFIIFYFVAFKNYTTQRARFIYITYFMQLFVLPSITNVLLFFPVVLFVFLADQKR